jgi:mono/diheme cytochrome c family protein
MAACASTGTTDGSSAVTAGSGEPLSERSLAGRNVFSTRCQRCHALPAPTRLSPDAWPGEVAGMSRKAGLSPDQVSLVIEYLVAASRSGQRTD